MFVAKSINNFFSSCISNYTSYFSTLISKLTKYNKTKTKPPSIKSCRRECLTFFNDTITWKNAYHNFAFGHLSKQLIKIDNYISQTYSPDIYWDASHGTNRSIINNKYKGLYLYIFIFKYYTNTK